MAGFEGQEITLFIAFGILIMVSMALVLILFYGRAQRKLMTQELRAKEDLLHKTILAQEEERTRIARELHDDIGSKLSVMSMFVKQLGGALPSGEKELVEEIDGMITRSMDTTRRISHELLPPTLQKFGLVSALTELAEGYEKAGTQLIMETEVLESLQLTPEQTLNLFRIVQELSKNSIQHGKASEISLTFRVGSGQGGMSYQDNGAGVKKAVLMNGKGLGISNIDSRVKMLEGTWEVDTSPGNGLKATVVWPLSWQ